MNIHFNECPECGSDKIRLIKGRFKEPGGREIPDLERWNCPNCGETYYDDAAMERIEKARGTAHRSRRKALSIVD